MLEHLPERIEKRDEKDRTERVILDEVEPIQAGRRMHTNLLPGRKRLMPYECSLALTNTAPQPEGLCS
jgi:hypothetical protein